MEPMYTARLDIAAAFAPVNRCPGCGSAALTAVGDGERTEFHCQECGMRWRYDAGVRICVEPSGGLADPGGTRDQTRGCPRREGV